MSKESNEWALRIVFVLLGVVIGMTIMYLLFVHGIDIVLKDAQGFIGNININLNETKIIEEFFKYSNQSGVLK